MIFLIPIITLLLSGSWATIRSYYPSDGELCYHNCQTTRMGIAFTEQAEGLWLSPYKDIGGNGTICFGHLIQKGEHFDTMTLDQCDALLKKDMQPKEKFINAALKRPAKTSEFDSLTDLLFNTGIGNKKDLFARVNKSQDPKFLLFNKARINGKLVEVKGLTNRRKAEASLYSL